jgi:YegS/Rv2252/BmrU family lipid kinase
MLADWDRSRARTLANAGIWTVRAVQWRERVRKGVRAAQFTRKAQSVLRLVYSVTPAPSPTRAREDAAEESHNLVAPKARIIVNPTSGSMRGDDGLRELRQTAAWLGERGLPTEVCETQRPGHAVELAREAVKAGLEMVIAAGGDGTVNDVVQALAGHTTALGVLPMGTVNVWARETGIPLNLAGAREVLVRGVRRRMDLGRAGSRYYLLMAGVGFDAEVARRVENSPLKQAGLKMVDYFATVGLLGMTQKAAKVWMRCDGKRRTTHALMILIGNTRLYGGAMTFAKDAIADDGLLDVVIIGSESLLYRGVVFGRALLRRASLGPRVRNTHCRSIRLESSPPLPVQVDGDFIGMLPMTFSVVPAAITVAVPETSSDELFERQPVGK